MADSELSHRNVKQAAVELLGYGLSPLPIAPSSKMVPTKASCEAHGWEHGYSWKYQQDRAPVMAELDEWLRAYKGCWIGIACGAGSGNLEGIDFDIPGKHDLPAGTRGIPPAYAPWEQLIIENGFDDLLAKLVIVKTTSGGIHVYYRCETIQGNKKLALRPASAEQIAAAEASGKKPPAPEPLIETRGQGGLMVVPPTPGYTFLQGDFSCIPTISIDERNVLIEAAKLLDESDAGLANEVRTASASAGVAQGSGRAGDDYEARTSWEEILEPHGWRKAGRYGSMQLWVRPGKTAAKGHSARTGQGSAGNRFVCWSSAAGVPMGEVLTKFALYAHLNHNGDYKESAKKLGSEGYGAGPSGKPRQAEMPFQAANQDELDIQAELDLETPIFEFNDLGNARLFAFLHGGMTRHVHDWERWIIWDQCKWAEDAPGNPSARDLVHRTVDHLMRTTQTRKWGRQSSSSGKISAMLSEAKALPGMGVRSTSLDTHDWYLNFTNCMIDLRTGEQLPHDKELMITKSVNVAYDPDAACPEFWKFLNCIMKYRTELVDLLVRALGYSLSGSTKEQKFFLMYGERGRNGKSTLMELMQEMLGEGYCYTIRKQLLTDSGNDSARFSKSLLEGKRLTYANETSKKARFDMEFLKDFVGGGYMEAERKGKDGYQFKVRAKLWYAVNSLPGADFDNSFRSRIVPIPFEQSFYPEDSELWREGDLPPDPDLPEKLKAEMPGIMALLVAGCVRWHKTGLITPEEVRALAQAYQDDNDHIAAWVDERCTFSEFGQCRVTTLFKDYTQYCKDVRAGSPGKIADFLKRMLQFDGLKHIKPQNRSMISGLDLLTVEQSAFQEYE